MLVHGAERCAFWSVFLSHSGICDIGEKPFGSFTQLVRVGRVICLKTHGGLGCHLSIVSVCEHVKKHVWISTDHSERNVARLGFPRSRIAYSNHYRAESHFLLPLGKQKLKNYEFVNMSMDLMHSYEVVVADPNFYPAFQALNYDEGLKKF